MREETETTLGVSLAGPKLANGSESFPGVFRLRAQSTLKRQKTVREMAVEEKVYGEEVG